MAAKKSSGSGGGGGDAYTGMLWLSLVATLTGLVFLVLDWQSYTGQAPKPASLALPPAARPDGDAAAQPNP